MDLQLHGKRALVTGSNSGIGEAIAMTLAREGASVVVHGRREGEAKRVAAAIVAAGGKAAVALGDLAFDDAAAQVAKSALAAFGGIDILVNNAGAFPSRGWMDATPAEWSALYNQNVGSMVRMIQLLSPQMKTLGWGRIIQIASGVAAEPVTTLVDYAATKAASVNLTGSLAKFLAHTGITANVVSPGAIATEGLKDMFTGIAAKSGWGNDWAEIEKRVVADVIPNPCGRLGLPQDVADAVVFLASPRAGYINGANIRVDGGLIPTTN